MARILLLTCLLLILPRPAAALDERQAQDGPFSVWHFRSSLSAIYGIGIYSAVGLSNHSTAVIPVYQTGTTTGTLDLGILLAWQTEPQAWQFGNVEGETENTQRLHAWATVGHTVHFGRSRTGSVGLHLFAGWTQLWVSASINNRTLGIDQSVRDQYGRFNAGTMLNGDWRFSDYLGLYAEAAVPFWNVFPSYATTLSTWASGFAHIFSKDFMLLTLGPPTGIP